MSGSGSSSGSGIFARPKSGWSNKSRAIGLAMKKTKNLEEKFRGDFAYEEDSGDGEVSHYQFSTGAASKTLTSCLRRREKRTIRERLRIF